VGPCQLRCTEGMLPLTCVNQCARTEPVDGSGTTIRVSVIVPAYNNACELSRSLSALRNAASADTELIVVDDGSSQDVSSTAAHWGARVLRLVRNAGPATARNYGARHARGQVLLFIDADVVVANDVIRRIQTILDCREEIAAVFGSYDAAPAAPGLISQYRNLLHHFVHQKGKAEASTFWAGCGAVRRAAFERVGGFDEQRFPRPSIEDIELGYRLRRAGYHILLDKSLQSMHLKRWTLRSVIRTDIVYRAIPWCRLIVETGEAPDDLNVQGSQRVSVALTGLGGLFLLTSPLHLGLLLPGIACLATIIVLNLDLYAFFRRARGIHFAVVSFPLHLLYFFCCGLSYAYVRLRWLLRGAAKRLGGGADPS
jgi:GT2 family glycosyltransferase